MKVGDEFEDAIKSRDIIGSLQLNCSRVFVLPMSIEEACSSFDVVFVVIIAARRDPSSKPIRTIPSSYSCSLFSCSFDSIIDMILFQIIDPHLTLETNMMHVMGTWTSSRPLIFDQAIPDHCSDELDEDKTITIGGDCDGRTCPFKFDATKCILSSISS